MSPLRAVVESEKPIKRLSESFGPSHFQVENQHVLKNMNLDRKSAGQKVCKGHSRGPLCEDCTVNAASKGCTRTLSLG